MPDLRRVQSRPIGVAIAMLTHICIFEVTLPADEGPRADPLGRPARCAGREAPTIARGAVWGWVVFIADSTSGASLDGTRRARKFQQFMEQSAAVMAASPIDVRSGIRS